MTQFHIFKPIVILAFTFISSPSFANNGSNEIHGLVLDRTITLSGHDFYQRFAAHWLAANMAQPTNIVIIEKPSARWGNLIIIRGENNVLYQTSIRPRKQLKKNIIIKAASTVSQNIFNHILAKKTSHDMASTGF